ncbi:MAG: hypothetical protein RLZZ04_1980 [Cyanobacteriota bacterium]
MKYSSHQKLMINNSVIADNIFVPTQEIIFIDSQVEDYQILAQGVLPGIEVVVLTSDRDGIVQITSVLNRKDDLTTIHLVSHGSPGCLYLGNTQLNLDTLNKFQNELKTWFDSASLISHPLSLLIYGCNVAAGDAGEEFITKLHKITGAEIAASTTLIGNADLDGNWELDYQTSELTPRLVFNLEIQKEYAGILEEDQNPLASDLVEDLTEELVEDLPNVTTDKQDYAPGSTAEISGDNFQSGETIELQVLHNDDVPNTGGGHDPWQVTDGGEGDLDGKVDGNFLTTWYVNPDDSLNSSFDLTAIGLNSGIFASHAFTDSAPVAQTFYVPGPETDLLDALKALTPRIGTDGFPISYAPISPITSIISLTASTNNTVIYYDHWEDGYEVDLNNPTQSTTQIWGDNNSANGIPPGFTTDALNSGSVSVLKNDVVLPRSASQINFDGRDKIGASKAIAVTRSGWAGQSSTLLADSWEVADTLNYGTTFKVPVGENVNTGVDEIFEYVGLLVTASKNGTTVNIDANADGINEITETLNEGEVKFINGGIKTGASITTSQPVQANLITGNKSEAKDLHPETSNMSTYYASRWYSLYPNDQLSNSYYTPVGDTNNNPTSVFVFNPNSTDINVSYEYRDTTNNNIVTQDIAVAPGSTQRVILTSTSGHHFSSTDNFSAVSAVSTGLGYSNESPGQYSSNNATYDWGHTLPPTNSLSSVVVLGWSPGSNDLLPNGQTTGSPDGKPDENYSPVWVTPTQDTRVYVNYSGNLTQGALTDPSGRKYDQHFDISRLDSLKISDVSDNDMTGARIYTNDGTNISVAWGQNPDVAKKGAPSLDIGNTVPPLPISTATKKAELAIDLDNNGVVNPGDTLEYSIDIKNDGLTVLGNVEMTDTISAGATYVLGSATVNGIPIADDATGTPFPFDVDGTNNGRNIGNINVKNSADVTYRMEINNPYNGLTDEVANLAIVVPEGEEPLPAGFNVTVDSYKLSGTVYNDTSAPEADSIDPADTPISGVEVKLFAVDASGNPTGNAIATATTNAQGLYEFTGLANGNYVVVQTQPNGLTSVTDVDGTNDNKIPVTIAGADVNAQNFLEEVSPVLYKVSGKVLSDTEAPGDNTISSGDTPLPNVEIKLFAADVSGNPTGNAIATATTDPTGNYEFADIPNGNYVVVQTQPNGLNSVTDNQIPVTVAGADITAQDFLEEVPAYKVSGKVLSDTEAPGDNTINPGDTPVPDVEVKLFAADVSGNPTGNAIAIATTDPTGNYEFADIPNGNYVVVQTQPNGLNSVTNNQILVTIAGTDVTAQDFLEETPPLTDYGDAPDTQPGFVAAPDNSTLPDYLTTEADGGPKHDQDPNCPITIGETFDADNGTQQNAIADADGADEDGVFLAGTNTSLNGKDISVTSGGTYSLDVTVNAQAPVTINNNAATVTGTAYRDYDLDGTQDPATANASNTGKAGGEPGIGGVTVNAYDANNNLVATAITSDVAATLGQYTLDVPAGSESQLRLEFITPDGLEAGGSGTGQGDSIRFIDTTAGTATADVAFNRSEDYYSATSQADPWVVIPCYVPGAYDGNNPQSFNGKDNSNGHVLVAFRYDSSGNSPTPTPIADHKEVGTTYGVAYDPINTNIFVSAYQRSNTSFGPGGAGTIYTVSFDAENDTFGKAAPYVDLNQVLGAGTVLGDNPNENDADPNNNYDRDIVGLQQTGKTAFGDLEYFDNNLYTVNLSDQKLYAIPTSGTLDSSTIDSFAIPTPTPVANDPNGAVDNRTAEQIAGDMRSFGLGTNDGKIYIGLVDSVESSQNRNFLRAYIYTFDPNTGSFSDNPVFDFDLTYTKGDPSYSDLAGNEESWQAWTDQQPDLLGTSSSGGGFSYPQPMIADIEFDNGSMVIGLRDRNADQMGNFTLSPINSVDGTSTNTYETNSAGDILRAAPNDGGGYTLESNGSIPDGFGGTLVGGANSSNQGPGGDEFYSQESYGGTHNETALGGLLQLPGESEILSPVYDPITIRSGGVKYFNALNGDQLNSGFELYSEAASNAGEGFGKTAGLGDVEALLDNAPIEVGNRIFNDKDADGLQDANEAGIAGVTVRLFDSSNTEIAYTTTNAEGKYSFGGINAPTLLSPNTNYEIRIDNGTGTPLESYNVTLENADSNNRDSIDSDVVDNAGTPTISFTTGNAGQNNFTLDAGFTQGVTLVGWIDFNRDGVFADTEAVTLDTSNGLNTDGTANTLEFAVPADLESGPTAARFRVASGLTGDTLDGTTPNGAAPNGEVEDYVVNLVPTYKLSGTVYNDTNAPDANGIEPADTTIAGVTVELFNVDAAGNPTGAVIATQTTDATGKYEFTDLTDGKYIVVETQPANYGDVTDVDGGTDNKILATIAGADSVNNDFLEEALYKLSGTVYNDTNAPDANGIDPTDKPIDGVTVELFKADASGNPVGRSRLRLPMPLVSMNSLA